MKKAIVAGLAIVGLGTSVQAAPTAPEQGAYLGGIYSFLTYKETGFSSVSPKTLAIQGGWNFNKNFAVEGRLGFDAGSDSLTQRVGNTNVSVDIKVKSFASVLAKGILPVSDMFSVYGLAGFTSGKLEGTGRSGNVVVTVDSSDSSLAYGVGGEVTFAGRSAISLEWGRLLSGDGYDVDGIAVGYHYRF